MESDDFQVLSACRAIAQRRNLTPQVAIILGSGLGGLADLIEHSTKIPYRDIPGFADSSIAGHDGELVLGFLSGMPVVAMRGRMHLYEGYSLQEATFPVRCMQRLGAGVMIVSNASGGINPRLCSGDLTVIDQHINLMFRSKGSSNASVTGNCPLRSGSCYDVNLISAARRIARKNGFELPCCTYLATAGPNYETRAEYRFFSRIGADVVGMSTVPEVLVASNLGMRVLALSVVTNVACPDRPKSADHNEVLDWADQAAPKMRLVTCGLLDELSGPPD